MNDTNSLSEILQFCITDVLPYDDLQRVQQFFSKHSDSQQRINENQVIILFLLFSLLLFFIYTYAIQFICVLFVECLKSALGHLFLPEATFRIIFRKIDATCSGLGM